MSTSIPDFDNAPKFSPERYEPPRQHGCFFYGCIIAGVVAVLFLVAIGIVSYYLYRALNQVVQDYTAAAPRELPKLAMPVEKQQTLNERVAAFWKAVDAGTSTEPLVLTADDLNALLDQDPDLKGKIFVSIEGDKLKGQISIPLESLGLPMLAGRYLNGEAELKPSIREGVLVVTFQSIEVNGKHAPRQLLDELSKPDIVQNYLKDHPNYAERIPKLESIEIKDGKMTIKARINKPGTAPDVPKELPKNVLAPPNPDGAKAESLKGDLAKPGEPSLKRE